MVNHPILIQSTDKVNYQTHDNNMTTNREVSNEEDKQSKINIMNDFATTASGTLSTLVNSIKLQQSHVAKEMPQKQSKKYQMNLG